MGCSKAELSIVCTNDNGIRRLNHRYLSRDRPTNVIAFAMREGEFADIAPQLLGDVVISVDTAVAEAAAAGLSADDRFLQLLVHGILHLLGYDHESDPEQAAQMETKSQWLLKQLADHGQRNHVGPLLPAHKF